MKYFIHIYLIGNLRSSKDEVTQSFFAQNYYISEHDTMCAVTASSFWELSGILSQ